MRQLLLLRHGQASPSTAAMPDHARRLDQVGRDALARLRETMATLGLQVDLVLVSSARRTLQSLQVLSPFLTPRAVEPMDALYLASAADLLHTLRQVTPTMRRALVIGHNPGLHDLALLLAGNLDASDAPGAARLGRDYPTSGLAVFDVPDDWGAIGTEPATLRRFVVA